MCVCVSRDVGIRDSGHFIHTVLKWQTQKNDMSLHTFDPGVFAVCQATLSFPLSGSSHLWFGSVTQQLRYVCVCVCVSSRFFICHMVKTWLWLLLNQNASRGLQCQPLWSSWSGVISLFGRFKSSCSIISAPIAAHISLISNKIFIRNLRVWTIAHALQELPLVLPACQQLFLVCVESHPQCLVHFLVSPTRPNK